MLKPILLSSILLSTSNAGLWSYMTQEDKLVWNDSTKEVQGKALQRYNGGWSSFKETGVYMDYNDSEHTCISIREFNQDMNFDNCVERVDSMLMERQNKLVKLEDERIIGETSNAKEIIIKRLNDEDSGLGDVFASFSEKLQEDILEYKYYVMHVNNGDIRVILGDSGYDLNWDKINKTMYLITSLMTRYSNEKTAIFENYDYDLIPLMNHFKNLESETISNVMNYSNKVISLEENASVIGLDNKIIITKENIKINASRTSTIKFIMNDIDLTIEVDEDNSDKIYWMEDGFLHVSLLKGV